MPFVVDGMRCAFGVRGTGGVHLGRGSVLEGTVTSEWDVWTAARVRSSGESLWL